jgi:hypothetical protein
VAGSQPRSFYSVDPAPLGALVAAVIGLRDDLLDCMKVIAEDDENGPIHLIHLLAACEFAAKDVGGGLPSAESIPGLLATHGGFITASVSPYVLPNLVRALRQDGLVGATKLAREYSKRERFRALDVLVHYVAGPIIGLQIDLVGQLPCTKYATDATGATNPAEDSEKGKPTALQGRRQHSWWKFSLASRRTHRPLCCSATEQFMNLLCFLVGHSGEWHYVKDSSCEQRLICVRSGCSDVQDRTEHETLGPGVLDNPRDHTSCKGTSRCNRCGDSVPGNVHDYDWGYISDDYCEQAIMCIRCAERSPSNETRLLHSWGDYQFHQGEGKVSICGHCGEEKRK